MPDTRDEIRLNWQECERWASKLLVDAGASTEHADAVAWGLAEGQAAGIATHGLIRLPQYCECLQSDVVNPKPNISVTGRGTSALLYDADGGYGYAPMRSLVDELCSTAKKQGIAIGAVKDSHHFGAAWIYASRVARAGMAGLITTNASANLVAPGAVQAIVGNNPLALVVPGGPGRPVVCADVAMSQVAFGRIRIAARLGEPIPQGWARGRDGKPTTDAAEAVAAQLLEPMAGHKGLALAAMIEILAGIMTGSPFGVASNAHAGRDGGVGHLAIVFDPTVFISREALESSIDKLDNELRGAMTDPNAITMPGQREERARQDALRSGLVVAASVWERLQKLEGQMLPQPIPA